jgi:hypothetical protein
MSNPTRQKVSVLKVVTLACAISAAGGAVLWAASADRSNHLKENTTTTGARMPSFEEMHSRAHLDNLPVQEIKEPY